jgi:hypothetical protein
LKVAECLFLAIDVASNHDHWRLDLEVLHIDRCCDLDGTAHCIDHARRPKKSNPSSCAGLIFARSEFALRFDSRSRWYRRPDRLSLDRLADLEREDPHLVYATLRSEGNKLIATRIEKMGTRQQSTPECGRAIIGCAK